MTKINRGLITETPENLKKFTVLLGKNASGKSTFLKNFTTNEKTIFHYLTPERSGTLSHITDQAAQITKNPFTFEGEKYKNQLPNFHQLSTASFVSFLTTSNNKIADAHGVDNNKADTVKEKKNQIIGIINKLIPDHEISISGGTVNFQKDGNPIDASHLSSGTSQVYSIVFDIAHFLLSHDDGVLKYKILLLDEPDAHLHPDLQYTLVKVINEFIKDDDKIKCIIATHSTSILAALNSVNKDNTAVSFVEKDKTEYDSFDIDNILTDLVPVFGAHPLTQIFNDYPVLLLEGEDDVFVFQTAIKSSRLTTGKDIIKLYPCDCGGGDEVKRYEDVSKKILGSIYDNPKIYSLRDRDNSTGEPSDEESTLKIIRAFTTCREIENLVLSNEVLESLNSDWDKAKVILQELGFANRYTDDIKNNVNTIISKIKQDNGKSWEILVGRAIGRNIASAETLVGVEGSIFGMIGIKATNIILGKI